MKKFDKERIRYVEANEELIIRLGNLESLKSTMDDFPKVQFKVLLKEIYLGWLLRKISISIAKEIEFQKTLLKSKKKWRSLKVN